jgi:tetratricopeptide (TPR) repeat protein
LIEGKRFDEAKEILTTLKPREKAPAADWIRYAEAHRRIDDLAEAEAALRKALEADPTSTNAWVLLVNTLVSANKPNDAEAEVENAKARLPAEERELVLGQCYEVLRDAKRAEESFRKFYSQEPESLAANRAIAGFYLRANRLTEADKFLDFILKKGAASTNENDKQDVEWAKRARAVVIASEGSWERFKEAEAMLPRNAAEASTSDLMLRIGLLAPRTEPASLRASLVLYEELQKRQPLQVNEQVQLARLYERVGQWPKAKQIMLGVMAQRNPDPLMYLAFAEMLARNREYGEAENWIHQYDLVRRDGLSLPILITLRVRQERPTEAIALGTGLIGPAPWPANKRVQAKAVATIFQNLRLYAEAEKIWREYAKFEPTAWLAVARCVGMHGDLDEAFALLETAAKHHSPLDVVGVGMQILRARKGETQNKHFQELARWYKAALQADEKSAYLQMLLGDIREIRGELDLAEKEYRRVLARTDLPPQLRAAISNNLAFILSTQNRNTEEALKLVDDSMKVIGPSSDLLDTRGVVYLAAGRHQEALQDFQEAILVPTAMKWVHMAFAQKALGDDEAARGSLKKAQELDLKREDLYADEWTRYQRLAAELGL